MGIYSWYSYGVFVTERPQSIEDLGGGVRILSNVRHCGTDGLYTDGFFVYLSKSYRGDSDPPPQPQEFEELEGGKWYEIGSSTYTSTVGLTEYKFRN